MDEFGKLVAGGGLRSTHGRPFRIEEKLCLTLALRIITFVIDLLLILFSVEFIMLRRLIYFLSHLFFFIYIIGSVASILAFFWGSATERGLIQIVSVLFVSIPLLFNAVYWIVTGENFYNKYFPWLFETKKEV